MTAFADGCVVAVFAKAPQPGAVKTRLIPRLGAVAATQLHARLVRHTLATARAAQIGPVELWCASDPEHAFFRGLEREFGITRFGQPRGDLGERMTGACGSVLARARSVVLVGTDCPTLAADDLHAAAAALDAGEDVVLGPAEDGGYYLIGMRRNVPQVFERIEWSTERVLGQTRERLAALGLRWSELAQRWDVDRPADYARMLTDAKLAALTREHVRLPLA